MYTFKISPNKKNSSTAANQIETHINVEKESMVKKVDHDDFHQIFTAQLGERFQKP